MKVRSIDVEISTHANKHKPYLYNHVYSFAKDNKLEGTFGNDSYILKQVPKNLMKFFEDRQILWRKIKK